MKLIDFFSNITNLILDLEEVLKKIDNINVKKMLEFIKFLIYCRDKIRINISEVLNKIYNIKKEDYIFEEINEGNIYLRQIYNDSVIIINYILSIILCIKKFYGIIIKKRGEIIDEKNKSSSSPYVRTYIGKTNEVSKIVRYDIDDREEIIKEIISSFLKLNMKEIRNKLNLKKIYIFDGFNSNIERLTIKINIILKAENLNDETIIKYYKSLFFVDLLNLYYNIDVDLIIENIVDMIILNLSSLEEIILKLNENNIQIISEEKLKKFLKNKDCILKKYLTNERTTYEEMDNINKEEILLKNTTICDNNLKQVIKKELKKYLLEKLNKIYNLINFIVNKDKLLREIANRIVLNYINETYYHGYINRINIPKIYDYLSENDKSLEKELTEVLKSQDNKTLIKINNIINPVKKEKPELDKIISLIDSWELVHIFDENNIMYVINGDNLSKKEKLKIDKFGIWKHRIFTTNYEDNIDKQIKNYSSSYKHTKDLESVYKYDFNNMMKLLDLYELIFINDDNEIIDVLQKFIYSLNNESIKIVIEKMNEINKFRKFDYILTIDNYIYMDEIRRNLYQYFHNFYIIKNKIFEIIRLYNYLLTIKKDNFNLRYTIIQKIKKLLKDEYNNYIINKLLINSTGFNLLGLNNELERMLTSV
jgi:hypothetical protein